MQLATAALAAGDSRTAAGHPRRPSGDTEPGAAAPPDLAILDAALAVRPARPTRPTLDRLIERGAAGDPNDRARAQAAAALVWSALGWPADGDARAEFASFDLGPGRRLAGPACCARCGGERWPAGAMSAACAQRWRSRGAALVLTVADRAAIASALLDRVGLQATTPERFALEGLLGLEAR